MITCSEGVPLTAVTCRSGTVFVNDTPLNSFLLDTREVVITPLLKQGRNEIRIVSSRVPNAIEDNDINFEVSGPARYNALKMNFEAGPICQFKTLQSWGRDKRTGQLVNKVKSKRRNDRARHSISSR